MKNSLRYALLAGAVVVAGAGVGFSQVSFPSQIETPAPTDMAGQADRPQGRFADRFMAEFDINHDGKVTKDEFGRVVALHFMQASGGKPTMTVEQFTNAHMGEFKQRVGEMFHRIDWNGDGRLSLEEFAAPIHARFETMDRVGAGVARCFGPKQRQCTAPGQSAALVQQAAIDRWLSRSGQSVRGVRFRSFRPA